MKLPQRRRAEAPGPPNRRFDKKPSRAIKWSSPFESKLVCPQTYFKSRIKGDTGRVSGSNSQKAPLPGFTSCSSCWEKFWNSGLPRSSSPSVTLRFRILTVTSNTWASETDDDTNELKSGERESHAFLSMFSNLSYSLEENFLENRLRHES